MSFCDGFEDPAAAHVHDPSVGVHEAFLDGRIEIGSGAMNTTTTGGIIEAEIGIHYAERGQGPVQIYVDDVAVARTRVACD